MLQESPLCAIKNCNHMILFGTYGAGVQWEGLSLVQGRKILQSWSEAITPSGLGVSQWSNQEGFSCSSQRPQSAQQRHKEFGTERFFQSFFRPHEDACSGGTAEDLDSKNSSTHEEVARLRGGQGVAQETCEGKLDWQESFHEELQPVWPLVQNPLSFSVQVLSSELQGQSTTSPSEVGL